MAFESLQGLSDELARVVTKIKLSTARIDARNRIAGSGIVWSAEGVILTADHVVEREENIVVQIGDASYEGELAGRDPTTDIAVVRIKGANLVAADIADSKTISAGNLVIAVGRPWGDQAVVSAGVVSAFGRFFGHGWGEQFREGLIHADVTLYPGFSGGPLADMSGRVVGMNTSVIGRGMALAIPTETAARVVADLLREGRVRRGFLGVAVQKVPLGEPTRQKFGLGQETGLMVLTVERESAAEKGGFLPGDILVSAQGTTLARVRELHRWLGGERAGNDVQLKVIRGGEIKDLKVTIGER